MAKNRYAYFPGCVTLNSAREVQDAMLALARALDIELVPLKGAACCGAGVMKQANWDLQIALNARTFAQAEAEGLDVLTPCATCQGNMSEDFVRLSEDSALRERVNENLEAISGLRFEGTMKMRHLLHVLVEDIGLDFISEKVKNPIDFPVAGYYGSVMQQEGACGDDDVFDPHYFEQLIEALGGESVNYDSKTKSVGFPSLLSEESSALKMTAAVLSDAKSEGAKIMASACPLSHINLDTYQVKAGRVSGSDIDMPAIHLPELVAFALGCYNDRYAQLRTRVLVMGN
ncbi:MAG: CoB--CoM heterodisulfide reductase iron-sulfur subunit B family protein [Candidatus Thalassarchaeaceae archaeon]|nr:CoB--CoM heterodisulfide reductase iron-sulfur subunit B family protein [Candidatus Thalassarchaeaceae archaeon]MDP7043706.1 CoB--CoM heterodisulfide reductase iron-sulfur subunit B family protein [Candidatus Thalassarchaeaceae archaeon]